MRCAEAVHLIKSSEPMERLLSKSDKVLDRISREVSPPKGWRDDARGWFIERELALGILWNHKLARRTKILSQAEIDDLLSLAQLETALGALGDAARCGLLSLEHCYALLANTDIDKRKKSEGLKKELQLRLKVEWVKESKDVRERRELLDTLLHQSRFWPLRELLVVLSDEELDFCSSWLDYRFVLTREARGDAREAIRAERKRRKS